MLTLELFEKWSAKYKKSINCSNPKGFSQKAHCAGRKKHNESVDNTDPEFIQALRSFLPIVVKHLKLKSLPKIHLQKQVNDVHVASFGGYDDDEQAVTLVINNRQPADILRTLAHELVHWSQGQNGKIDQDSWQDGSELENEANAVAGVIMREFARQFPQCLEYAPIYVAENLSEAEQGCPPATQDISLNLKNRQKAIDEYHYGPLNPNLPNDEYWQKLADKWNTKDIESVKQNRCGNCGAFDVSEDMQACIAKGIGSEPGSSAMDAVDAGELGYCKFLKFKCASKRTCDAWIEGGPITEQLEENLRDWFKKEKWVRMDTKGNIKGPCAREPGEGKPKCLPQAKAHALGKKGRASAAQKKRREDPNPERKGKAINVSTKESQLDEKCWKGYHKEGNKKMFGKTVPNCVKNENQIPFDQCPQCGGEIVHESLMNEKQDACYHKVKSRYKVWPSAYASGALVQCRKKGAKNWGNKTKKESVEEGKRCDSKGAVPELKAALDNRKTELNKLSDKEVYNKIDKIMSRIANTYNLTGQELHDMWTKRYGEIPDTYIIENFADGKGPGRPGDSQRHGIPKGATMAQLEKAARAPGRKGQLARWQINMRRGKKK